MERSEYVREKPVQIIYILLEIPSKISVSSFMGFLKGKSSLMIYEKNGGI